MVEIRVADTGTGIVPEISAPPFRPFITTKPQGMALACRYRARSSRSTAARLQCVPILEAARYSSMFTPPAVDKEEAANGV
jgi:hypothetical protein